MGKNPFSQKSKKEDPIDKDLGFSKEVFGETRLINPDGSANVIRKGVSFLRSLHLYNFLITISWPKFLGLTLLLFFLINLFFGFLYWIIGVEYIGINESLSESEQFWTAFYFSTQTITTVGYGHLFPNHWSSSFIAALEALVGLLCFAIATGLVYARFVRPNIKLRFSEQILVSPFNDNNALMFRLVNERATQLVEVSATCFVSFEEGPQRKFAPLKLQISKISMLVLNWTVVHPITEESPFWGLSQEEIVSKKPEIVVMISGFEETFGQTVYYRTSYDWNQWIFGGKFNPITEFKSEYPGPVLNVDEISSYEQVPLNPIGTTS